MARPNTSPVHLASEATVDLESAPTPAALALAHAAGLAALSPGRPLLIGTADDVDLRLVDRYASARHARIFGEEIGRASCRERV